MDVDARSIDGDPADGEARPRVERSTQLPWMSSRPRCRPRPGRFLDSQSGHWASAWTQVPRSEETHETDWLQLASLVTKVHCRTSLRPSP